MSNKKMIPKNIIDKKFEDKGKPYIHALSDCYGYKDKIDFICDIHKCIWSTCLGSTLYKTYSCPECFRENTQKNKLLSSNLQLCRPDIAALLKYPETAKNIFSYSKEKHWFICPVCGANLFKSIFNVVQNGLICNNCSDGYSYPNKFMFHLLDQLHISFISEFSPDWISPKRYDFYFEKDNKKYIVEMDGGLGHGKKIFSNNKIKTLEQSLQIDLYKDQCAKEHGIHVIRIPSDISEKDYLIHSIMTSKLSNIINLDKVNFDDCDDKSRQNYFIKTCSLYNKYPFLSYDELVKEIKISEDTIRRYLKKGYNMGLCPKYKRTGIFEHVICVESQIIFPTFAAASRYYNIDPKGIARCCRKEQDNCFSLHFMFLCDYDGDIDNLNPNEEVVAKIVLNNRQINMYDNKFQYVQTYNSVTDAAQENNTSLKTVIRSCKSKHKYNYGKTYYYADDPNQPDKTKIIAA